MNDALSALASHVAEKLGDRIERADTAYGELTLTVDAADIVPVLTFLRDDSEEKADVTLGEQ